MAPVFERAKTVHALYIFTYVLRLNVFPYLYNNFKYVYTNCRRTGPVMDFNTKMLRSIQSLIIKRNFLFCQRNLEKRATRPSKM
jgi:hypothetical protein